MDKREELIYKYIIGKKVLDLGVGDIRDRFLHAFIKKHSKEVVGIELDRNRAENLRKKGYNIIEGDAETINLEEKFDVIVAGDIIEHLNNPGMFLKKVREHLNKDGIFICNTPNIYSINLLIRGILQGGNVKHLDEHTLGFTEQLIRELFYRHNLKILKAIYFCHEERTLGSYIVRTLSYFIPKWKENMLFITKEK